MAVTASLTCGANCAGLMWVATCHNMQVARAEGLSGFYRGFGAVLSGVVPATALYFGGYETGKRLIPGGHGVLGDMLVGCYTQASAGIVFTPVDIIKERMQVRYPP